MVKQCDIYWIALDPTKGSDINKKRPGVVITPDDSNQHLNPGIIAPVTSSIRNFPMRVNISVNGKYGQAALDQIRSVDKVRLLNKIGSLKSREIETLQKILREYLTQ